MRRALLLLVAAAHLAAQAPYGTIHGIVKDAATGEPLPNFTVKAGGSIDSTGERGLYSLSEVPSGTVTISASGPSRTSVTREVQLNPGDDVKVDILIPPNATISGRVLNADSEPQADVSVWVVYRELIDGVLRHTVLGPQVTGPDGSYKFRASLPVGSKFYVAAERNPKQELVSGEPKPLDQRDPIEATTYFGDALTLDDALPLRLAPAEQRSGVDIKISHAPYYCADGTVDVNGKPASAPIAVYQRSLAATSLRLIHAASAADGTFHVCGLTAGQYLMSTMANRLWSDEEFFIADSDVHHLRLTVDAASLHLTVVWNGDPSPRNSESMSVHTHVGPPPEETTSAPISIQITGLLNQISMGRTLDGAFDGPFGLQPAAGDYAVNVFTSRNCCYVKELSYNGVRFTDHRLHLAPGAIGTLRVVLSTDGGNLTCTVPDGASAMLFSADGPPQPIPALGASWRNLAPGKYRVLALTRPLQLPDESDKLTELLSQAQEVEIEAKLTKQVKLDAVPVK